MLIVTKYECLFSICRAENEMLLFVLIVLQISVYESVVGSLVSESEESDGEF